MDKAQSPAALTPVVARIPDGTVWVSPGTLIRRGVLLVVTFGAAYALYALDLDVLPVALLILGVFQMAGIVWTMLSVINIDGEGIHFPFRGRGSMIRWREVFQIMVHDGIFNRTVSVYTAATGETKRRRIPVPRTTRLIPDPAFEPVLAEMRSRAANYSRGANAPASTGWFGGVRTVIVFIAVVIVATSIPDRPWGWAGTTARTTTPDACPVLSQFGTATQVSTNQPRASICTWSPDGARTVTLEFDRFSRSGLHSAWDAAEKSIDAASRHMTVRADSFGAMRIGTYSHAGDAYGMPGTLIVQGTTLNVLDRAGNIAITITMTGAGETDQDALKQLAAIAKAAAHAAS